MLVLLLGLLLGLLLVLLLGSLLVLLLSLLSGSVTAYTKGPHGEALAESTVI